MDPLILLLRLVHVGCGVFWAGTILFLYFFLAPSIAEAGPDGAKVMQGMTKRNFLNILPVIAALTILSGLWLYWIDSGHFQTGFMRSRYGMALGLGGAAAIVAFVIGIFVMRAATVEVGKLAPTVAQMPEGEEKRAAAAHVDALRARFRGALQWVAVLLLITVIIMAIARYLG